MRLYDYAASANCYKVRLLLALLDRPYERVPVELFGGETLTAAFAEVNPLRETPVLELDDGARIAQSPAILTYLAEDTPFLPGSRLGRAHVAQWLAFEQERVMGGIGGARFRRLTGRPELPDRVARGAHALAVLDAHLRGRAWLVGDRCTVADIAVFGYAHVAGDVGLELPAQVAGWCDRVRALPGFVSDLEPYGADARPGRGRSIYD